MSEIVQEKMFPSADLPEVGISESQADLVTRMEEGQFSDVKSIAIAPAKLSHTISAFANTDGGELYIGISEQMLGGNVKQRDWDGFPDIEAANGHMLRLRDFLLEMISSMSSCVARIAGA